MGQASVQIQEIAVCESCGEAIKPAKLTALQDAFLDLEARARVGDPTVPKTQRERWQAAGSAASDASAEVRASQVLSTNRSRMELARRVAGERGKASDLAAKLRKYRAATVEDLEERRKAGELTAAEVAGTAKLYDELYRNALRIKADGLEDSEESPTTAAARDHHRRQGRLATMGASKRQLRVAYGMMRASSKAALYPPL